MGRIDNAVTSGRLALAVSGSLLRDASVVHALSQRVGWAPMTLGGNPTPPVTAVGAAPLAAALGGPDGIVALVEPDGADGAGLAAINRLCEKASPPPTIVVVSRTLDLLRMKMAFPRLAVEHHKARGKDFLDGLPARAEPASAPAPTSTAPRAAKDTGAPRFCFAGRDEEVASLAGLLAEPGPVVVTGPAGIGKTSLVEHAIAAAGKARLPWLSLGWGVGADTVFARLAAICREAGDESLAATLRAPHTPMGAVSAALAALRASRLDGQVLVVGELQHALSAEGDFFRRSRLELLLEALLTEVTPLTVVFTSTVAPRFHREAMDRALRRVGVAGLKGRFYRELFDAMHAPDFPREWMGPLSERLHGHPMSVRLCAVAVRDRADGLTLLEDAKFLAAESADDLDALRKHLARRVEKLDPDNRGLLSGLAHLRIPVTPELLTALEVKRQPRLDLLTAGLLETVGVESERRFRVHGLVRETMSFREVNDFDAYDRLGDALAALAGKAAGVAALALAQEANRCGVSAGRAARTRVPMDLPDHDGVVDQVQLELRSREPRLDGLEGRIVSVLAANPSNADAWLLRVELALRGRLSAEELEALLGAALDAAPCPELVQQGATAWIGRKDVRRAAAWLAAGIARMPDEARLCTRLAALLHREGRRNEAVDLLRRAMDLQPLLPDATGLLGLLRRDEGAVDEAEQLLREAVRLAPGDVTQTVRLADLLGMRARVDDARALRAEARELLEPLLKGARPPEAALLLATLLREDGEGNDRRAWLLDIASKGSGDGRGDRGYRVAVERALHGLAEGRGDDAESALRDLLRREPSGWRAFAALGHVLELRGQPVPAHAEYLEASKRAPQGTLERTWCDAHVRRLAGVIESEIAQVFAGATAEPAPEVLPLEVTSPKIKRRGARKASEAEEA
jgi:tetratricopeptide (TPR) repeat protein